MRKHRRIVLGAGLLALALVAAACNDSGGGDATGGGGGGEPADKGEITVGVSGAFAENQLVAEMYAQVLENSGYTVSRELDIESREVGNTALASGEIDLKPEYLGFELAVLDPKGTTNGTPEEVAASLQAAAEAEGWTTYAFSPANSTNVFVVTPETAQANDLTTMSSLAPVAGDMTLGAPPDCAKADFCAIGLKETYGIEFADIKSLDSGGPKTVAAIDSGAVDVGELFSLDPTITDNGYTVLEDDKQLQAAGNFVPIVRDEVASEELGALLDSVTTTLTDESMRDMVGQVQNEKRDVADVATEYLEGEGLLG
jgi:osmoprotectant transport system substrate-binding protein